MGKSSPQDTGNQFHFTIGFTCCRQISFKFYSLLDFYELNGSKQQGGHHSWELLETCGTSRKAGKHSWNMQNSWNTHGSQFFKKTIDI